MKSILIFILSLISAFSINAQTTVCHKDSIPMTHSYELQDTSYYNVYEIVGSRDSIVYKMQCGKPCQLGLKGHRPHQVIDKMIQIPIYDSVQHETYSTYTVTEKYDSFFLKCDTLKATSYSIWGNGDNVTQKNIDALKPYIKGWNDRISWKDFNPSPGVYNWSVFDDAFSLLKKNNLAIGFMVYVGDNAPDWIYSAPYNVPKVLTTTGQTFPFYNDVTYNKLVRQMWLDVANHIKDIDIDFWMIAEGSTGDVGDVSAGYKGTPINPIYAITPDQWSVYRRSIWTYIKGITSKQLMVNPGNKDKYNDMDWADANIPGCWFKSGNSGHQFNLDGELTQIKRNWQYTSNDNKNRFRTELENVDVNDATYTASCATQQGFLALISNVDMFCIAAQRASYLLGLKYFNDYAGLRDVQNTTRSFVYMSGGFDSTKHTKAELLSYKSQGAMSGVGFWYDDIGSDIAEGDYERFIDMVGTTTPRFRVKSTGFGRYGRILTDATFTINTQLEQPSKINVVVYDESGDITINGVKFTGTNTKQERTLTVPLSTRSFKITGSLTTFLVNTE